jgi:DegV family protein with EDD domain
MYHRRNLFMSYKIIGDSCTDLTTEMKIGDNIKIASLSMQVDDVTVLDDETFDQKMFLELIDKSPNCPKSSCPSPEAYMELFSGDDDVYVVTLSSNLSGSYNSAELAKKLYLEEHPNKNIEIIDSRAASVAQTLIVRKLQEFLNAGKSFHEIVTLIEKFRDEMHTKFVLENLDTLRKNGRLSGLQAIIASALNIKPVMAATKEGTITKLDQARGINKALIKMAEYIEKDAIRPDERTLGIAHCNAYERALFIRDEILKHVPFKDTIIVNTGGISTMYANDGGVIISY